MRGTLISGLLGTVLLMAAGAALAGEAAAQADVCATVGGTAVAVAEVIDGDTLGLADGRIVHVAGVEAMTAAPLAAEATRETRRLVAGGVALGAPSPPKPDRYGRLHADARLGEGGALGAALVSAGLARVRLFPGEKPCLANLLSAEAAARAAHRGLWSLPDFAVRRADDPSLLARSGLYELVEGRIASVGHGKRMVFLDFGRDYRRDFTVLVPIAMAEELPQPVDALKGRRVRVRGVIEESGGPAIRLATTDEIEFVDGN